MYYLLKILSYIKSNNWFNIIIFIAIIYTIGSFLMVLEPEVFDSFQTYTWWFIVTSSTVGYGDIYPSSELGRVIGTIIIIGGVGSLAMVIGKLSEIIININRIKIKGLKKYNMKDHIVLMGYHEEQTPFIIDEIIMDKPDCKIILCSNEVDENPFIDKDCVSFVKGDLISENVLTNSCIKDASKILIHAPNDSQSVSVLLAVLNTNKNKDTNIVLNIADSTYNKHVEELVDALERNVETVTDLKVPMMVQSLLDSGSSDIINQMLCNDGSTILQMVYEGDPVTFLEYSKIVSEKNAILIGVNKELQPDNHTVINEGDSLYYLSHKRI